MTDLQKRLRTYFIMGSQNCQRDPVRILEEAAEAGITAFQYREKGPGSLSGNEKLALGQALRQICRKHNILFFINNDVELIEPLEADGIHVGQTDKPVSEIRSAHPDILIGLSLSTMEEAQRPETELADYFGVGPVYRTTTKLDAKEPKGVQWIQTIRRMFPDKPFVGIGGINEHNASEVLAAGADGIAVVSAIAKASDIEKTVQSLKKI